MALKVVGVELTSIGCLEAEREDEIVMALEDTAEHLYRKLVISNGKIVGAILLGYPTYASSVTEVIKQGIDVTDYLDALRAGGVEWGTWCRENQMICHSEAHSGEESRPMCETLRRCAAQGDTSKTTSHWLGLDQDSAD